MSPASGDFSRHNASSEMISHLVSIQLMSPASGDIYLGSSPSSGVLSFHSINVPSEWGRNKNDSWGQSYLDAFPFN